MTKFRLASDLHLEFYMVDFANHKQIYEEVLPPHEDDSISHLILAGDVCSKLGGLINFLRYCTDRFKGVYFIPGNHEFYGADYLDRILMMDQSLPLEVNVCLEGFKQFIIEDVSLYIGTLWGDGGFPVDHFTLQQGLSDFRAIRYNDELFTVQNMIDIHNESKQQLKTLLNNKGEKSIVCTHHMPLYELVDDQYKLSPLTGGFVGNCSDIILDDSLKPNFWLFGHTHMQINEELNGVKFICNPCGYPREIDTRKSKIVFIEI